MTLLDTNNEEAKTAAYQQGFIDGFFNRMPDISPKAGDVSIAYFQGYERGIANPQATQEKGMPRRGVELSEKEAIARALGAFGGHQADDWGRGK